MSILNVDKIQPIGGGSTITVDATDIQASTGTIRASTFSGDVSATGIGVTSLNIAGVTTTTDDIKINADNKNLKIGAGEDLSLFHNGTDSRIVNTTGDLSIRSNSLKLASTTGEEYLRATANSSVDLFHDNVVKLTTNSDGYRSNDNVKAQFGNSGDMEIYHDGTENYIRSNNGAIIIRDDTIHLKAYSTTDTYVSCVNGGAVSLRYDNSVKLTTETSGVNITGVCTATSFSGSGENLTRTTPYSHRNVVINGGMQIAQRGTSSTGNTSGGYKTCDRWELSLNSAGTWTVTQSSTCPDGFNNSIKLDCTTANTSLSSNSFLSIRTAFEGRDLRRFAKGTTSAKAMTVSFYVKTNKNGTYAVELYDVDNTKIATSLYTVSNSNWNRYEFTIPASTNTGQFNNDNNKSMNLGFILAAGTNYTNGSQYGFFVQGSNLNRAAGHTVNLADSTSNEFYLTGVQLEEGEIATPFEHRSDGDTLMDCYRYYVKIFTNTSDYPFGYGYKYGPTTHAVSVQLPTRLRGTPTCTFSGLRIRGGNTNGTNNAETVTSLGGMSYSNANFQSFTVNTNVNSAVVGQTVLLVNSVSNNTTYINFDAEL
jgi:hypothetical protein